MKTILGCAAATLLLGSCLAGVKGEAGANDCQSDAECPSALGQRCSSGSCVNAPCNVDTDCDPFGFALICDRGVECRLPCAGYYGGGCPAGTECIDTFCESVEIGSLSLEGYPRPLGPGAAGGGGEPPYVPIPDDGYEYDYGGRN